MNDAVIVSAVRTPTGKFGGSLSGFSAIQLGAEVISEAVTRAGIETDLVDEVIMGNVLQAGQGQNPARQASMAAQIPFQKPAWTLNKVCGSGLKSVALAAQAIESGNARCIVAGGMESMTNAPYVVEKARWGVRMGNATFVDVMIRDGLWEAFYNYHMGITAENVAEKYGITREEQDVVANDSHRKTVEAIAAGAFVEEIKPITIKEKKTDRIFDQDESPRPDTTYEKLSKLKPVFKDNGTVTAGNASGINDGAAAMVIMDGSLAASLNLKPLARIVSYAAGGVDPAIMGIGPVPATNNALAKAKLKVADIDLIEANEAFAAQYIAVCKDLEFDPSCVNINGGAIALGHPIGASGTRILTTLLYALKNKSLKRGLATLCIGGGQGMAMIVERI